MLSPGCPLYIKPKRSGVGVDSIPVGRGTLPPFPALLLLEALKDKTGIGVRKGGRGLYRLGELGALYLGRPVGIKT